MPRMKKPKMISYATDDVIGSHLVEEYAMRYLPKETMAINTLLNSDIDVLHLIKKGISKKALNATIQMMGISLDEMAEILHVSERTLRRFNDDTKLNTEQSERIMELTKLYYHAEEVLGSLDNVKVWMNTPILALGQQCPKYFLDTSLGIGMLNDILGRIEHGIYS